MSGAAGYRGRVLRVFDDGEYVGRGDSGVEETACVSVCAGQYGGWDGGYGADYGECEVVRWVEFADLRYFEDEFLRWARTRHVLR